MRTDGRRMFIVRFGAMVLGGTVGFAGPGCGGRASETPAPYVMSDEEKGQADRSSASAAELQKSRVQKPDATRGRRNAYRR